MTSVNSEETNLQQKAMTRCSVRPRSSLEESVTRRPLQISDSKIDELKARVSGLYETHRDGIYRFLMSKGRSPTIAQELTQDVFVDLFVALEKGKQMESEQAWLYAVAGRTSVDHWRRKHRQRRLDLDSERSAALEIPSSEPTPEAQAGDKEQLARIATALQNLQNEQRLCIQLRAQGLRYREIANVLRISTSTAAEWLLAAVDHVREHVNGKSPLPRTITAAFGRRAIQNRSAQARRTSRGVFELCT